MALPQDKHVDVYLYFNRFRTVKCIRVMLSDKPIPCVWRAVWKTKYTSESFCRKTASVVWDHMVMRASSKS